MDFSLINHNRGYQIRASDMLLSLATGYSGAPYAIRHYDLSSASLGHKFLCAIEFAPVLGGIVALIELVASTLIRWIVWAFFGGQSLGIPWRSHSLSVEKAMHKMHINEKKAIREHRKLSSAYAPIETALLSLNKLGKIENTPLKLTHSFADDIGPRGQMEDAHFFTEIDQGALAAVFDGHRGRAVSCYASQQFEKRFSTVLNMVNGNVHQAFETLVHQIHQEVAQNSSWNKIGSTAVICFIDKKTHLVYTCTLGDSEANIYRKIGWTVKSIPLSPIRDWTSKRDAKRLEKAHGVPGFVDNCLKNGVDRKQIRSRLLDGGGVNVSRAIGDVDETGTLTKPIVIHKPKITMNKLRRGDKLLIVCDGVKDYVSESEICIIIEDRGKRQENLARKVVRFAIDKKQSQDNVTVLSIEVA